MLTARAVKARARELGFDLCGVAPAVDHPELRFLERWLAAGYAGEMAYLARTAARRRDVRAVVPSARSVVVLGTLYNVNRPYAVERHDPSAADISRYAWGEDYHDVLRRRGDALLDWMKEVHPEPFEARFYVDTGPVQERVYAQYAGVGWIGKNTCVINPDLGSWLFLSEIICSLRLETDPVALDQCGTCTLCLEACPTQAFVEPGVLDATRCLSYLTIEVKGPIPETQRADLGAHVYGCDICQEVCPWNAHAATSDDPCWQPHAAFDGPSLRDLWQRSDDEWRALIGRSAMSHTGLRNLRRNVAIAMGNSGSADASRALAEPSDADSAADPVVAEHCEWARRRLAEASRDRVESTARELTDE